MNDYSQYPYAGLLKYIDEGCKRIGEERDFVQYVISMNEVESIEEMINRYNNIYKLIAVIFFGTNKLPASWYNPKTWGYNHEYLVDELNLCLNKSILGWLKRQENPTTEMCRMCIANLRNNEKYISVENDFRKKYFDKDKSLSSLLNAQNYHYYLIRIIQKEGWRYKNLKEGFVQYAKFLAGNGRIFDIVEISICEENDIASEKLVEQYKKEVELEKNKAKKERKERIWNIVIYGLMLIPLTIIFVVLASEINVLAIIIIIGLLGSIPKLLLTGKL